MKNELKKEIHEARKITSEFNKFEHLFSKDDAQNTLYMLNRTLIRIEQLLELDGIKDFSFADNEVIQQGIGPKRGALVSVRPVGAEYQKKTYLGFLLGDLATGTSVRIEPEKFQCKFANHNPAIFVPELGKIIFGYESWWGEIESEEQLKQITDEDIQNVWYVQLWQKMNEAKV